MTDKEFRNLRKSELIDIIFEYQKEEKELKDEIKSLKRQLEKRDLKIEDVGNIAEATVGLSGIFENAQRTAEQYLQYVYEASEQQAQRIIKEAQEEAKRIRKEAIEATSEKY